MQKPRRLILRPRTRRPSREPPDFLSLRAPLRYDSPSGICLVWDVRPSEQRGGAVYVARSQVSRPTILVVDDEPAIRTMVRRMLARLPCTVVEASDGDEALAYVRRERPQLILLDIVMPRL